MSKKPYTISRRRRRSADFRDDLVRQGSDLLVDVVPVRRVVQALRSYPLREEFFRGIAAFVLRARVGRGRRRLDEQRRDGRAVGLDACRSFLRLVGAQAVLAIVLLATRRVRVVRDLKFLHATADMAGRSGIAERDIMNERYLSPPM